MSKLKNSQENAETKADLLKTKEENKNLIKQLNDTKESLDSFTNLYSKTVKSNEELESEKFHNTKVYL